MYFFNLILILYFFENIKPYIIITEFELVMVYINCQNK